MPDFLAPKGVLEYYPPLSRTFVAIRRTLLAAADRAGYSPIELATFEDTALFARGVGESTDVVTKEMYTFTDRGGRSVTLRPEGTAGVMRAVIEYGLDRGPLPVKLAYAGPFFRYERPQAGRYRQLQQVGIEAIGSDDPALDAEVISVADDGYRAVGLTGYRLDLTSLGDAQCRPAYREALQQFLSGLDLDADDQGPGTDQSAAGARRQAPGDAGAAGGRAADDRRAVRRLPGALRRRAGGAGGARHRLRDQSADGPRTGLLHPHHLRVRPRRTRVRRRRSAAAAGTTG